MKVKKKITKKKLKQPDEFISFTERSYLFISQHLKQIAGGVILVLVILVAFFLFRAWDQKREDEANQKFLALLESYQRTSAPYQEVKPVEFKKILDGFEDVVKNYPRTKSAHLSLLYKGGIHLRISEFDDAIRAYETFLAKAGKERLYRILALEGLGYAFEGKKDYEKALKSYQEIIKFTPPYEWAGVHLNLARCYEKLGKKEEALQHYKTFLKDNPKSFSANSALRKVSLLEK